MAYVLAGGALMAVVNPHGGILSWGLILLLILAFSYVDARWAGGLSGGGAQGKVVRLGRPPEQSRIFFTPPKEKRVLVLAYSSGNPVVANDVIALLRKQGLAPVLVTENEASRPEGIRYNVLVPQQQAPKAQALIESVRQQKSEAPS